MKPLSLILLALTTCLACACAAPRGDDARNNADNQAGASGSGVEVFGTLDAGVSHTRTQPGR